MSLSASKVAVAAALALVTAVPALAQDVDLGEGFLCCNMRTNGKEDPKAKITAAPPAIRAAIESFKVARGMTREQVIIAIGYPMSSENPSLDAKEWKYWLHSFSPFNVMFDAQGRVVSVESDPATLDQVFAR
ncbi:MAG: outer membrane protein assembly factor BamE [Rubrivivax sp.]|jgi:outer membrane protein assembly factor BamE (lipoprotein component of BamABCDE complex)|nr:outer membrane protein assembly factor BamE [Rubrivivax sp.]